MLYDVQLGTQVGQVAGQPLNCLGVLNLFSMYGSVGLNARADSLVQLVRALFKLLRALFEGYQAGHKSLCGHGDGGSQARPNPLAEANQAS